MNGGTDLPTGATDRSDRPPHLARPKGKKAKRARLPMGSTPFLLRKTTRSADLDRDVHPAGLALDQQRNRLVRFLHQTLQLLD